MASVRVKILWLLRGDRTLASSRLQGYLIHRELVRDRQTGFDSEILLAPPVCLDSDAWTSVECALLGNASRGAIVVLQKLIGPNMAKLPALVREAGGQTVFVHCDYEPENDIPMACDVVVTPSEALAAEYRARGCRQVVVIPDPAELSWPAPTSGAAGVNGPTIGWIGHRNNWESLEELRGVLLEPAFSDFRLVTVSDHPRATIPWSMSAMRKTIRQFDVAVVPVGSDIANRVKSANRVALFMAAGVPVIAGRIPAYESVISHGVNGLLFSNDKELRDSLCAVRSPGFRRRLGSAGFETARMHFTVGEAARRWQHLFADLARHLPMLTRNDLVERQTHLTELKWRNSLIMCDLGRENGKRWYAFRRAMEAAWICARSGSAKRLQEGMAFGFRSTAGILYRRLQRLTGRGKRDVRLRANLGRRSVHD
jgi:hypothetical protein